MTPRGGARGALVAALLALAGCATAPEPPAQPAQVATPVPASQPTRAPAKVSPYAPAKEDLSKRGNYTAGGLYAPGVPDRAPDELPRDRPLLSRARP